LCTLLLLAEGTSSPGSVLSIQKSRDAMADVKYLQGIRRAATSDTLMRLDGLIPKEHRSAAIAGSRSVLPPLHPAPGPSKRHRGVAR
jgi:hypothetical protein